MQRYFQIDSETLTMLRIAQDALTFDDVLLLPAHSAVLPKDVTLATRLTREIDLNIPLVSAAMDTVTEARLAITLALEGGMGIVHKNMTPEEQAAEVLRVKKYESGVVRDPITVSPTTTIGEVMELTRSNHISGVPVVDGTELVGIVTGRDLRFETRPSDPVKNIMTRKKDLVTVQEGASRDEVKALLHKHRIEKVLVVNGDFKLRGLITAKDIQKATDYPKACRDSEERLRVGAAVGVGQGTEERVGGDALVHRQRLQRLHHLEVVGAHDAAFLEVGVEPGRSAGPQSKTVLARAMSSKATRRVASGSSAPASPESSVAASRTTTPPSSASASTPRTRRSPSTPG